MNLLIDLAAEALAGGLVTAAVLSWVLAPLAAEQENDRG